MEPLHRMSPKQAELEEQLYGRLIDFVIDLKAALAVLEQNKNQQAEQHLGGKHDSQKI